VAKRGRGWGKYRRRNRDRSSESWLKSKRRKSESVYVGFYCKVVLETRRHRGGLAFGEDSVSDRDRIITEWLSDESPIRYQNQNVLIIGSTHSHFDRPARG
jgi:hypothetical protein